MAANKEKTIGGVFECSMCDLRETYHYFGKNPPFVKQISFHDDAYIMKDPFKSQGELSFLFLGADCVACSKPVCQTCSIFYTKRFCLKCAKANIEEFPEGVQKIISKGVMKSQSKLKS